MWKDHLFWWQKSLKKEWSLMQNWRSWQKIMKSFRLLENRNKILFSNEMLNENDVYAINDIWSEFIFKMGIVMNINNVCWMELVKLNKHASINSFWHLNVWIKLLINLRGRISKSVGFDFFVSTILFIIFQFTHKASIRYKILLKFTKSNNINVLEKNLHSIWIKFWKCSWTRVNNFFNHQS